jgi:hypothetical protein
VIHSYIGDNSNKSEEYIANVSITNSSDGLYNVNLNMGILVNMDYVAVETMWIDSSNNVITKQFVWNQTHVVKGQVFNISKPCKLSKTPSKVVILLYDNPYVVNDESNSHLTILMYYENGTWNEYKPS